MKHLFFFSLLSILLAGIGCNSGESKDLSSSTYPETAFGWKLGAGTYTFNHFTFFQAADKIDSCGLKYIEIFPEYVIGGGIEGSMDFNMDANVQAKVLKKLSEKGMTLVAYGVVTPKSEAAWRRLFEFGKAMGIQTLTSEPDEKDMSLLSALCDEYKINVAIHNHPYPKHYWNPDTLLAAIKGQSKCLGACADVGHWVFSGLNPVECLKKLEGHVLHVHMKDLEYREGKDDGEDDRDVHWGTGVVNVAGVIKELKKQNFKGMISAEYERNWDNNVPDVIASVQYFRNRLQ